MLRAIILAVVVAVALGMIVPVATEHTEASAVEKERQYLKKERLEEFRYRSRFRLASYSKSNRYIRTAKLRKPGSSKARSASPAARKVRSNRKATRTKKARRAVKVRRTRTTRRSAAKTTPVRKKRYTKVKRKSSRRTAPAGKRTNASKRAVKKSTRKYSKRWWRNYRARQAKQQAIARRKASMRAKREILARQRAAEQHLAFVDQEQAQTGAEEGQPAVQLVMNSDGTVSMVVVGQAMGETVDFGRQRTLAGVSTTALRRTVIDQMIRENGWVENDYHKEVAGQKVYVVVAKAPDEKNRIQSKTFYFAESKGRIYKVSASAPKDAPEEAAKRSEQMVRSLQSEERERQAMKE